MSINSYMIVPEFSVRAGDVSLSSLNEKKEFVVGRSIKAIAEQGLRGFKIRWITDQIKDDTLFSLCAKQLTSRIVDGDHQLLDSPSIYYDLLTVLLDRTITEKTRRASAQLAQNSPSASQLLFGELYAAIPFSKISHPTLMTWHETASEIQRDFTEKRSDLLRHNYTCFNKLNQSVEMEGISITIRNELSHEGSMNSSFTPGRVQKTERQIAIEIANTILKEKWLPFFFYQEYALQTEQSKTQTEENKQAQEPPSVGVVFLTQQSSMATTLTFLVEKKG